jgi:hypothetical protein
MWAEYDLAKDVVGSPRGYFAWDNAPIREILNVVYRNESRTNGKHHNRIRFCVNGPKGEWTYNDIAVQENAKLADADSDPCAYYDGAHEVYYRSVAGAIYHLFFRGVSWEGANITESARKNAKSAVPDAEGNLSAFNLGGTQYISYRGADHHVHELRANPEEGHGWIHTDLSIAARGRAPDIAGIHLV